MLFFKLDNKDRKLRSVWGWLSSFYFLFKNASNFETKTWVGSFHLFKTIFTQFETEQKLVYWLLFLFATLYPKQSRSPFPSRHSRFGVRARRGKLGAPSWRGWVWIWILRLGMLMGWDWGNVEINLWILVLLGMLSVVPWRICPNS